MKHAVPHDLGPERAKLVAEAAISSYATRFAKYNAKARWVSDKRADISFNVKGMALNGTLEVLPHAIEMDLDVPFFLKPFKSAAIGVIEAEIKGWLAQAKAGKSEPRRPVARLATLRPGDRPPAPAGVGA